MDLQDTEAPNLHQPPPPPPPPPPSHVEQRVWGLGYTFRTVVRAVYRNFAKGGRIWGMEKRGGAEALCVQSTPSRGIRGHAPLGKFCDFLCS